MIHVYSWCVMFVSSGDFWGFLNCGALVGKGYHGPWNTQPAGGPLALWFARQPGGACSDICVPSSSHPHLGSSDGHRLSAPKTPEQLLSRSGGKKICANSPKSWRWLPENGQHQFILDEPPDPARCCKETWKKRGGLSSVQQVDPRPHWVLPEGGACGCNPGAGCLRSQGPDGALWDRSEQDRFWIRNLQGERKLTRSLIIYMFPRLVTTMISMRFWDPWKNPGTAKIWPHLVFSQVASDDEVPTINRGRECTWSRVMPE